VSPDPFVDVEEEAGPGGLEALEFAAGAGPVARGAGVGGVEGGFGVRVVGGQFADAFEFPGGVGDFVGEDALERRGWTQVFHGLLLEAGE